MGRLRRNLLLTLLKLSDMCPLMTRLAVGWWFTSTHVRGMTLGDFLLLRIEIANFIGLLGMMYLWHIICRTFHLWTWVAKRTVDVLLGSVLLVILLPLILVAALAIKLTSEAWMRSDMEYIDNWSFLGDMKILLSTIPAVISGKGAS